jgi:leader peptidase (prepilin peptidase)/N-methyltransferase
MATASTYSPIFAALAGFNGLIWGSFAATVALRMRGGLQWAAGRSRCDACLENLSAFDLAPLISYCCLRGRCRFCQADIAPIHPIAEATGFLSLAVTVSLSSGPDRWLLLGAVLLWLIISLIDCTTQRIPNPLVLLLAFLGFFYASLSRDAAAHLIGALAVALSLFLVAYVYCRSLGKIGLGGGDIKLAGASALFVDPYLIPWAIAAAAAAGILWAVLIEKRRNARIAFGPFLAAAFWAMALVP